jgi:hypothetical protein
MIENRRSIARKAVVLLSSAAVVGGGIFVSAVPASASTVDTTKIAVSKLSLNTGAIGGGTVVLVTGKGFTRTGVTATTVTFAGTAAASIAVISDTQMVATTAAASAGPGFVVVDDGTVESDTAGKGAKWTYVAPLALTIATGNKLNPLGGTALPITSVGLGSTKAAFDALKVTATVGGAAATVKWISDTSATINAPAGTVVNTVAATPTKVCLLSNGVYDTTVANTSCDSLGATYATVISKLSVASSVPAGNSTAAAITITGKGFTGNTGVNFGASNPATCTTVSDTKLTCTIPSQSGSPVAAVVQIIITPAFAPYGTTVTSAFTYTDV